MTMYPDYASIFSGIFQKVTQSTFSCNITYGNLTCDYCSDHTLTHVADTDNNILIRTVLHMELKERGFVIERKNCRFCPTVLYSIEMNYTKEMLFS